MIQYITEVNFINFVKSIYINTKYLISRYENGEKAQYHFKSRNHMYNVKDKYRCYFCNSYVQDTKGKLLKNKNLKKIIQNFALKNSYFIF